MCIKFWKSIKKFYSIFNIEVEKIKNKTRVKLRRKGISKKKKGRKGLTTDEDALQSSSTLKNRFQGMGDSKTLKEIQLRFF